MHVKLGIVCTMGLLAGWAATSGAGGKLPMKRLARDPGAPVVELFPAIEQGTLEATVIARNSHSATVFVTNKSADTVNVQFPATVAAIPVLQQRGFAQRGPGNNNGPGNNGPGGGQSQPVGGGQMQGNNPGMNGQVGVGNNPGGGFPGNGPGIGMFSVPSQTTVQVPISTVCLAHGKPEPRSRLKYQLVPIEEFSKDPVLHETLKLFVSGAADTETAQAAVWHLTDKLSWDMLRDKQIDRLSLDPVAYFGDGKVDAARALIDTARERAKQSPRPVETASRRKE